MDTSENNPNSKVGWNRSLCNKNSLSSSKKSFLEKSQKSKWWNFSKKSRKIIFPYVRDHECAGVRSNLSHWFLMTWLSIYFAPLNINFVMICTSIWYDIVRLGSEPSRFCSWTSPQKTSYHWEVISFLINHYLYLSPWA